MSSPAPRSGRALGVCRGVLPLLAVCLAGFGALKFAPQAGAQGDDMLTLQFSIGAHDDPSDTGTIPGHFVFPFGVAVDSTGRFIVTDTEELIDDDGNGILDRGNRVQIFRPDGTLEMVVGGTGSGPGQFLYPVGVAVDALDQIIVADSDNNRIQILSPATTPGGPQVLAEYGSFGNFDPLDPDADVGPAPPDRFYFPSSVAVRPGTRLLDTQDADGRLAIVDNGNHRVVVLDSQLNFVGEFGGHTTDDNPPGTFEYPWGVTINSDDQGHFYFYVSDPSNHRVQVFDENGLFLWAFGSDESSAVPSAADLSSPSGVGFDHEGRLLVADTDRSRVLRIALTDVADSQLPRCANVDASDDLHQCQVLASDGRRFEALVLGGYGSGDAQFLYAQGVGADADGRVVVVDTDQHVVKVFQPARIEITAVNATPPAGGAVVDQPVGLEVTVANHGGSLLTVALDVNASLSGTLTGVLAAPIEGGAEHTFDLTFVPEGGGPLTFTVAANGLHSTGTMIPAPPVTTSPITVAPAPFPKLLATISANRTSVGLDGTIDVTVTLTNSGNTTFTTVYPVVTFPPGIVAPVEPVTPVPPVLDLLSGTSRALTYSYTAQAEGTVTFELSVSATYDDTAGSHTYPTVTASSESVRILADTEPPVTTATLSAQPDPSTGWHRAPFTVTLTADDRGGSGVAAITYDIHGIQTSHVTTTVNPVTIAIPESFQGGTTITFFATDANGTIEQQQTRHFYLDSVAPDMGRASVSAPPNAAGWNNTDVVVSFIAGDGASGIASITAPVTVTTEGAGQVIRGTARDQAGNESQTQVTLNIDKTPPVIAYTLSSPPNANGWHNQPVTVTFSATDPLSGVASLTPPPTTISADGVTTITATAIDVAGNVSTRSVTIKVDRTPPTVLCRTVSGGVVWPPNHKMVPWTTSVLVQDLTSGSAGFILTAFSSSESDNGRADGNTTNDIQGFVIGQPDTSGFVRAERAGTGDGRTYSLLYQGRDLAGNVTACTVVTAEVPHDQGSGKSKQGDKAKQGGDKSKQGSDKSKKKN